MKKLIIALIPLITAAALLIPGTGCTTTTSVTNGVTNTVTTIDTAKLSNIREVLEPVASSGVRRALKNSPEHAAEIALYMRSVGQVFCDMHTDKQFSPNYLVDALSKIADPRLPDDYVKDIKNSLVAVYKLAFSNRFSASIPPDQWVDQVAQLICGAIDTGLRDVGQAGLTKGN